MLLRLSPRRGPQTVFADYLFVLGVSVRLGVLTQWKSFVGMDAFF